MSQVSQPSTDRVWSIELHGIEAISDEERHGTPFELITKSGVPPYEHKGFHVGFTVTSIEEARTALIARGLEPVGEIQSDSGNFWCYFQDPEGNLYQIMETPD